MHNAVSTAIFKISTKYPIVIFLFVLVCFLFFGLAQWYRGYPRETDSKTLTLSCTVMQFHVWCFGHIKQPIDFQIVARFSRPSSHDRPTLCTLCWKILTTRDSWKKPHVIPSLRGLFPLSDPWHSSQAPSHRPSTIPILRITFGS